MHRPLDKLCLGVYLCPMQSTTTQEPLGSLLLVVREAQREVERTQLDAQQALAYREALVDKAIRDGFTHAQIAEATGLTRVGQIARLGRVNWGS